MANNTENNKKSKKNKKNNHNSKKSIGDWLSENEYVKIIAAMIVSLALFALNMGIAVLAGSMPLFFVMPLVILTGMGLYDQGKLSKGTIFTILVVVVIIIDILVMMYLADQGRLNIF